MHWICGVEYEAGYRLRLAFEDGSLRRVDLEHCLDGEVFEPLRDLRRFRTAHLNADLDTVVWENGADMSPDFLYEIGIPVEKDGVRRAAESKTKQPRAGAEERSA